MGDNFDSLFGDDPDLGGCLGSSGLDGDGGLGFGGSEFGELYF